MPHGRLPEPDPGRRRRSAHTCRAAPLDRDAVARLLADGARDEAGAEAIAAALADASRTSSSSRRGRTGPPAASSCSRSRRRRGCRRPTATSRRSCTATCPATGPTTGLVLVLTDRDRGDERLDARPPGPRSGARHRAARRPPSSPPTRTRRSTRPDARRPARRARGRRPCPAPVAALLGDRDAAPAPDRAPGPRARHEPRPHPPRRPRLPRRRGGRRGLRPPSRPGGVNPSSRTRRDLAPRPLARPSMAVAEVDVAPAGGVERDVGGVLESARRARASRPPARAPGRR